MSEITELAWKTYQPILKRMIERSMDAYKDHTIEKHYDGDRLSGVLIYRVVGNTFYCDELFIDSTDKSVFGKWYKMWQTKADRLVLKTTTLNDKLINFLSKRGARITDTQSDIITMEVDKNG